MTVRELKNAKITHISYVDKVANKKTIFPNKISRWKAYISKASNHSNKGRR